MKTKKRRALPVDFKLPPASEVLVVSVSGNVKSLAQLRLEAKLLTYLPGEHPDEDALQHDCYSGIYSQNFRHLCFGWHTPNGGSRYIAEAMKFTGMGVKKGVPDMIFIMPVRRVLYIELKNGHYRREPDQELFEHKARKAGFEDVFCVGTLREFAALMGHIFDLDATKLVFP